MEKRGLGTDTQRASSRPGRGGRRRETDREQELGLVSVRSRGRERPLRLVEERDSDEDSGGGWWERRRRGVGLGGRQPGVADCVWPGGLGSFQGPSLAPLCSQVFHVPAGPPECAVPTPGQPSDPRVAPALGRTLSARAKPRTPPHLTDRSTQRSCAGEGACQHSCRGAWSSAPLANAAPGVGSPGPLQLQPQTRAWYPTAAGPPSSPWGLQSASRRPLCGLSTPELSTLRPRFLLVWSWAASFSGGTPRPPQMW